MVTGSRTEAKVEHSGHSVSHFGLTRREINNFYPRLDQSYLFSITNKKGYCPNCC